MADGPGPDSAGLRAGQPAVHRPGFALPRLNSSFSAERGMRCLRPTGTPKVMAAEVRHGGMGIEVAGGRAYRAPTGHVYARLVGHGLVLVPHWPYTFERPDTGSEAVVVTHWRPDGPARALVDPSEAQAVPGVVDVEPGPDHPYWVIETTG